MHPRSRKNFLSQFLEWWHQLWRHPAPSTSVREVVIVTLTESDLFKSQAALAVLNKIQQLQNMDPWTVAVWKVTPLTSDHGVFYYLFCMEIPRSSTKVPSLILSTGVRKFHLKRSQGVSWGKHQLFVFKSERHDPDSRIVIYSRNCSFIGTNAQVEPNRNANVAMRVLARRLLTIPPKKVDWEKEVRIAIAGWGELEPRRATDKDFWQLDKK